MLAGENVSGDIQPVPPPQVNSLKTEIYMRKRESSESHGSNSDDHLGQDQGEEVSGSGTSEADESNDSEEEEEAESGITDGTVNMSKRQEQESGSSSEEAEESDGSAEEETDSDEEEAKITEEKHPQPVSSHRSSHHDVAESRSKRHSRERSPRSHHHRSRSHHHRRRRSSSRRSRSRERKYSISSRGSPHRSHRSKRSRDHRRRSRSHGRRRRSRSRHRHHRSSRHHHSDRRRSRSRDRRPRSRDRLKVLSKSEKKPTFKEMMKQQILQAQQGKLDGSSAVSVTLPTHGSKNLVTLAGSGEKVTPQQALLQTMAAMHAKAQEATGVALPKYYNPAAVNPLKYAEQVQKRKLLWSKNKDGAEKPEEEPVNLPAASSSQWSASATLQGEHSAKFRKLMGIKGETESEKSAEAAEEQQRKQDELFSQLDREYAFARMATHTHRGVGLGFASQGLPDNS